MKQLPNILTILRIALTVAFVYFLMQPGLVFAFLAAGCFMLASLSDYYDGYLAKKYNWITNFGKLMDPIADKFLMLAAFYIFMRMHIVMAWMFAVIALREVLVTGLRIAAIRKKLFLPAERAGKLKTVSQMMSVGVILVFIILHRLPAFSSWMGVTLDIWMWGIQVLLMLTVALTVVSGISYVWNNRMDLFRL